RLLAVGTVERELRGDVDVGDAVAVGEAEALLVGDVVADAPQPAAGHRALAGVDQRHAPRLGVLLVHFHRVLGHVERDVRHVQEVVGEVLLDDVALVAAADDEVVDAAGRVDLQDVPEDRPAADLDHRLGLEVGLLRKPAAEAAGEDDGLDGTLAPALGVALACAHCAIVARRAASARTRSTSATTRAGASVIRHTLALSLRSRQPARSHGTHGGEPCRTVVLPARWTSACATYGTSSVGFGGHGPK